MDHSLPVPRVPGRGVEDVEVRGSSALSFLAGFTAAGGCRADSLRFGKLRGVATGAQAPGIAGCAKVQSVSAGGLGDLPGGQGIEGGD